MSYDSFRNVFYFQNKQNIKWDLSRFPITHSLKYALFISFKQKSLTLFYIKLTLEDNTTGIAQAGTGYDTWNVHFER